MQLFEVGVIKTCDIIRYYLLLIIQCISKVTGIYVMADNRSP